MSCCAVRSASRVFVPLTTLDQFRHEMRLDAVRSTLTALSADPVLSCRHQGSKVTRERAHQNRSSLDVAKTPNKHINGDAFGAPTLIQSHFCAVLAWSTVFATVALRS